MPTVAFSEFAESLHSDDPIELPPQPAEELVWHYTARDTLEKILRTSTFWATDISGLNDPTELRTGIRRVWQAFEEIKRDWDDREDPPPDFDEIEEALERAAGHAFVGSAFVTCFSLKGDKVSQWMSYAAGDGFAIGIPRGVYLPVVGADSGEVSRGYIEEFPLRWLQMKYKKREQLDAAKEGIYRLMAELEEGSAFDARHPDVKLSKMFNGRASSVFIDAVASLKNKEYIQEREVRYAVARPNNPRVIRKLGENREYVPITGVRQEPFERPWNWHNPEVYQPITSKLPIRAIRIGPKNEFDGDRQWVSRLLADTGYTGVKLKRSKAPFK